MGSTVEFIGVTQKYGSTIALNDFGLHIPRGSVFGLLGPKGAGKTTAINIVTTLLRPTVGTVRVLGHDVVMETGEIRKKIGFVPEEPLVYSGLTGREFVALSATLHGVARNEIQQRAVSLLETFDLSANMDNVLATCSKGMRRKTLIAAALVCDPELLILDEPMEGLDVYAQGLLKDLLKKRAAGGQTVIYSTHIVQIAEGLCTHLAILDKGTLVATGTTTAVKKQLRASTLEQAFENRLKEQC
ncbi:MAG: ABC transporter ATP-binding protein [Myxococcota bacterium]|nr:ABC transporter ATP-binding protein [Myxococcota bacterium]